MEKTPRPNPQRVGSLKIVDGETVDRRLHCARYDDCLDHAEVAGWRGFVCTACVAFVPACPMTEKRQLRGFLELTLSILRGVEKTERSEHADGDQPSSEMVTNIQPNNEGSANAA